MTAHEHPIFDNPRFPGNRKNVADYLARQEQAKKIQARREFWFKIQISCLWLASAGIVGFLVGVYGLR